MELLYRIPSTLLLVLAVLLGVAAAIFGQLYVHRRFRSADFVTHNEVGGFMIAVVGTLYAVLLGFLTIVIWQHFSDARDQVSRESAAAADAWHMSLGLPYPIRSRVRHDMLAYANIMIDREWPAMRTGDFSPSADLVVMDAISEAGGFTPSNLRESNSQLTTQQQLAILHDERQQRLTSNDSPVSWFEWLVLFICGICVVCFCWLFGLRNWRVHLLMTSAVTIVIVSTLVLLFELQYPFRSDIGIHPAAWTGFIQHVQLMNAGSQLKMRM